MCDSAFTSAASCRAAVALAKHLRCQGLDKDLRGATNRMSREATSYPPTPSLSGALLAWAVLWNCLASHTDPEMECKSGREMAQGVRKSHSGNRRWEGWGQNIDAGDVGPVRSLLRTPFTAHLWPTYGLPRRLRGGGEEWKTGKSGSEGKHVWK